MKKNISINISGIIFHIEEDGYESLRNYLESINRYFSSYEDSGEIVADIESRIAEIFLSKLKEGKQVITETDVESLMATMGSIEDFEAVEESHNPYAQTPPPRGNTEYVPTDSGMKKLYRDTKRKILGGVAAGIAHYFKVDPLWIRLILILLLFDLFISFSIGTIVLVGYIVCWIIVPPTDTIEEDAKTKKMFRNPDHRVLGGVAGGLAAYFGVDATLIRLLFIISIFLGGAGIIVYLILWIITPEAKTITDKMQMQGEPVTLSNIESNIRKSLNVKEGEEENALVKILLFPFRLLAIVFSGLGKALGPLLQFLVEALRILVGLFLICMALVFLFALFVGLGMMIGLFAENNFLGFMGFGELPVQLIRESFPAYSIVFAFAFLFIPLLALVLLGIAFIAKRNVIRPALGWSLFGLWLISLMGIAIALPALISRYHEDGEYTEIETFNLSGKTAILTLREAGLEDYQVTSLRLEGHRGTEYKLEKNFEAQGSSRRDAERNAQMVSYGVSLQDSVFVFDSNIRFKEGAEFRMQELDLTLFIPYNQPFIVKKDMHHILRNNFYEPMEDNVWQFTEAGLVCLTCQEKTSDGNMEYRFEGFSSLDIQGNVNIEVREGNEYRVLVYSHEDSEQIEIRRINNTLNIRRDDSKPGDRINISIKMPELTGVVLEGGSLADITGFWPNDEMNLSLTDSAKSFMNVEAEHVNIEMKDASSLVLKGSADYMDANLQDQASLEAKRFEVTRAEVIAEDSSKAYINVGEELKSSNDPGSVIENSANEQGGLKEENVKSAYISPKALLLYTFSMAGFGIERANKDLVLFMAAE